MKAPSGQQWVHEVKHDGYRLGERKVDGRVRLYTKQGYDWSKKYSLIAEALYRSRAPSVVLDGEAMCDGQSTLSDDPISVIEGRSDTA